MQRFLASRWLNYFGIAASVVFLFLGAVRLREDLSALHLGLTIAGMIVFVLVGAVHTWTLARSRFTA